jgi:hypothetical protein
MYRPVVAEQKQQQGNSSVRTVFFSDKNYNTLQTVLVQDFEQRNNAPLNDQQINRLSKTLDHYLTQVYQVQGEKPIQNLNKEVLSACAKDFSQYLQRKELTKNTSPIKTVAEDKLFQDTSQRYEKLTQERNEVKALPPAMPDFRIDLNEDGPPAAELYERAKKQREFEALRSASQNTEMLKAEAGLQSRISADSLFRNQQENQNRNTELALVQRQQSNMRPQLNQDTSLAILPDRRDLLLAPIGSFDTMTMSPNPRELGQANSNPTIVNPILASPTKNDLPQNYLVREEKTVNYREVESNLFIYSADRDWLRNNKENRYSFTVNFDPAANSQSFNPTISSQQKFKNIVRIELVKCIMPGESLDVTVEASSTTNPPTTVSFNTGYQDNILNFPYITLRVAELDNNNYGTDNFLDRSFGVLQYDAQWQSDISVQSTCNRGFLAMIPKFLKCQKEYYPTPLSTLQKMTIDLRRPNGELVSSSPDTFDIGGIISRSIAGAGTGSLFPFNIDLTGSSYDALQLPNNEPYNFFINTTTFFSKFEICKGDRIQISGYTYQESVLNDPQFGQILRAFSNWINRPEGHIVVDTAYSNSTTTIADGANNVGYANFIVIQARYQNPSTGSVRLNEFAPGNTITDILNNFGSSLESPCRLINLNKQLNLVFRIITREMDSLPQLRPDNNY